MRSMFLSRTRFGVASTVVVLWFASIPHGADGQAVFDPYRPESAQYNSSVSATIPNNLALPNAAREAIEYDNPKVFAGSRYNTFERYLSETGGLDSSPQLKPRTGPGVPYYSSTRPRDREYLPSRDADRGYYADLERRNKLYEQALKERDPVKRANLLREVHRPMAARPKSSAAARPTPDPRKPVPARRTNDPAEALSAEAMKESSTVGTPRLDSSFLDPVNGTLPSTSSRSGIRGILDRTRPPVVETPRRPPLPAERPATNRATPPVLMRPAEPATTIPAPPGADVPR